MVLMKGRAQCAHDAVVAEAFDGHDIAVVARRRKGQAGADRLGVDQDGAGAAHSVLATQMCPGQVAPLAQKIGEREPPRHVVAHGFAIHAQGNMGHVRT